MGNRCAVAETDANAAWMKPMPESAKSVTVSV